MSKSQRVKDHFQKFLEIEIHHNGNWSKCRKVKESKTLSDVLSSYI